MTFGDLVVAVVAIVSCALLFTAHVSIFAALVVRPPRWRAFVALVVPPLAPYWALREKLRGRAITWIASALVYLVARALAE